MKFIVSYQLVGIKKTTHKKRAYPLPVTPSTYACFFSVDVWESYSESFVIRRSVESVCSIPGKSCGLVCVKDLILNVINVGSAIMLSAMT